MLCAHFKRSVGPARHGQLPNRSARISRASQPEADPCLVGEHVPVSFRESSLVAQQAVRRAAAASVGQLKMTAPPVARLQVPRAAGSHVPSSLPFLTFPCNTRAIEIQSLAIPVTY